MGRVSLRALWDFKESTEAIGGEVPVAGNEQSRQVVPVPEEFVLATRGVGVNDKDHSNFEKVWVVYNYFENDDWSVNSATDIPEQKWHSVSGTVAFVWPRYYMIKAGPGKFHEVTAAILRRFMKGAQEALTLLQDVLGFLGLLVAWDKCEEPVCDVIFLGGCMCTDGLGEGEGKMSASLPVEKCKKPAKQGNPPGTVQFDVRFIVEWVPSKVDRKFYGPTRWPAVVFRVPLCAVNLKLKANHMYN
ncbi:hypothetical protein CYMTET_16299 [Cymbomonas tetramitiformis]|uniref:Uncharacterized protein n=1 Tax=Cymbomonas tetramitiformis TaxID=36881 RepID=A0AAE0GCE5_9CHLO|nr:hypothetical protein CYMTET_16299 [Cymbomonas tetramitiformis]